MLTVTDWDVLCRELSAIAQRQTCTEADRLAAIARQLNNRFTQAIRLSGIISQINAGFGLDDVMNRVFDDFRGIIPYERLGCALLIEGGTVLQVRWQRNESGETLIDRGYEAKIAGSSLETVLKTRRPRIINDLTEYLKDHPGSESTALILKEGIRSSLTCPLIVEGVPRGVLFFSSTRVGAYEGSHVDAFQSIADVLSVIIEKARLVSEIIEQKEVIDGQNEALRALNAMRNKFFGMAAHDLRGPITQFEWIAEVFDSEYETLDEETRRTYVQILKRQSRNMSRLLNDLMDIVRLDSETVVLRPVAVQLRSLAEDAALDHQLVARRKSISVTVDVEGDPVIISDQRRICQVLDNLISNAVKYSPPQTAITVKVSSVASGVRISVIDQGPGIPEDELGKLFQEFSKLSARPTGNESSFGLGLSIAKRLVKALGGDIGVITEVGKGSEFWFSLPLEPPAINTSRVHWV